MNKATVTFAYKANPKKYESADAALTIEIPDGMSPGAVMSAARAMVFATLGMPTTKSDRKAASVYLRKAHGEGASLDDFKSE